MLEKAVIITIMYLGYTIWYTTEMFKSICIVSACMFFSQIYLNPSFANHKILTQSWNEKKFKFFESERI